MASSIRAISDKIFPGAQLVVAKMAVIYEKAYGNHNYTSKLPTTNTDLFDIASVTKVTATLPIIMKMQEAGKINIDHTLGNIFISRRLISAILLSKKCFATKPACLHGFHLQTHVRCRQKP